jgi:hypothetical protein
VPEADDAPYPSSTDAAVVAIVAKLPRILVYGFTNLYRLGI